jgi:hypothetical protein
MLRFAAMSQDPRLEPALRAVWPGRPTTVTPIEAGITNRNFRVEFDDADEEDAYVLRLAGAHTELLGMDRNDEVEAGRAAAAAGVGPEIVAFLPELGCLVTRLLGRSPIPQERLGDPYVMRSIVASITAIDARPRSGRPSPCSGSSNGSAIRRRSVGSRSRRRATMLTEPRLGSRPRSRFAPAPMTTCHNDLLNANFLLDGDTATPRARAFVSVLRFGVERKPTKWLLPGIPPIRRRY